MYLVPELTYASILKKADVNDKYEMESINEIHKNNGFFEKSLLGTSDKAPSNKIDDVGSDENQSDSTTDNDTNLNVKDKPQETENIDKTSSFTPSNVSTPDKNKAVSSPSLSTRKSELRCEKCLKKYKRSHKCKGGKPFEFDCHLCEQQFRLKTKLMDHLKTAHKKNKNKTKLMTKYTRSY